METGMLTTEEAARRLGMKPGTLENWRQQKKGPQFIKLPTGAVRYTAYALDAWIKQEAHTGTPEAFGDDERRAG
jgi:predicted DNA-binding transcriptional regulator AlpA